MLKNVKCARCVRCGKEYEAVPNLTNCSCGGILDIVYDYDYIIVAIFVGQIDDCLFLALAKHPFGDGT